MNVKKCCKWRDIWGEKCNNPDKSLVDLSSLNKFTNRVM